MGARTRWAVLGLGSCLLALTAAAQQSKPKYSVEEHNEFTEASGEQDPQARVRALDAFLQKYPESALRPFVFQAYLQTYQGSNWPKFIEYADKLLALDPAQVEEVSKRTDETAQQVKERVALLYYETLFLRAQAFLLSFQDKGAQADAAAEKATQMARRGVEHLEKLPRPQNLTPEKFAEAKKQGATIFRSVVAAMAFRKKHFDTAAGEYKFVAEQDPNNGFFSYRLAQSYMQTNPPQYLPAFWAQAHAVSFLPENQKKSVRENLVQNLTRHQAFAEACPARHVQAQADELIARAKTSVTPPAGWTLPDAQQVSAVRSELPVKRIFDDLKAGSEQRQLVWVASCGLELPELTGDVLEVLDSGDNLVTLRLAVGEETTTTANVEVKVKAPPEAKNIKPATTIRFSGVLTDYQSDPFMLRLTEGKVNPEDIPKAETPAQRKKPRTSR